MNEMNEGMNGKSLFLKIHYILVITHITGFSEFV